MKTKLPSSSNSSTKRFVKCHGILSFLFILFMTVSSFGQSDGIIFTCVGAGDISFNTAPDGTFNGKVSWENGVDFENTAGYTLRYELDNTWSVRAPGVDENTPGPRFFYSTLTGNLPSCNTSWDRDLESNGASCSDVVVTCVITNDPDNDGDGYTVSEGDCDDNDDSIYPGATEICDGIDNNCDGSIDEGFTKTTYYVDADGDGFGDMNDAGTEYCDDPGSGYSLNNNDCDDTVINNEACYKYCNDKETKVIICHNGKDICVSINAIDAHIAHGDQLGSCSSKSSNNGKGEKAEEIPTSYDVAFWPNPSHNNFNVKLITPNITEKVSIEAYDINGRLIHSNIINGNENYQFGNNLSTGIYIVKLTQESTTKMIKVVKQ